MGKSEPLMVYQIKVTLNAISPPVWRRILVADKITLLDLHHAIQDVFGWMDYHLHEFTIRGLTYGDPANDEWDELDIKDETKFPLRKFNFRQGTRFTYQYDFGDSWNHTLVVEKILPFEKGMALPQCIKGVRACPPEDVGGPWGYSDFLEAIKDPHHEEHDRYLEWIGGEFDPDAFDLEGVNNRLRQRSKPNWSESPSFSIKNIDSIEPTRLAMLLTTENADAAQRLPLRQDVITFLNYLKDQ